MTVTWVHGLLVLLIFGGEGWLLRNAWHRMQTDWQSELSPLRQRFLDDVDLRARRGRGPDWEHYRNEMERRFEPVDERLRTLAAAALAGGLGATILALIVHLVANPGQGTGPNLQQLTFGMGVALLGSLAGVLTHLTISLLMLPAAERHFESAAGKLLHELETTARENPPADLLSQAVRDELQELRTVLDSGVTDGLTTAMAGFPEVVEALGQRVEHLAEMVEAQARGGSDAASEMKTSASQVATAAEAMAPAAESLASSVEDLRLLPERLSHTLDATRHQWIEQAQEERRKSWEKLERLVKKLEQRSAEREQQLGHKVAEVIQTVQKLPAEFSQSTQQMSDGLGREFGREAQHHVSTLLQRLATDRDELYEKILQHDREMRNNIGTTVAEIVRKLSEETHDRLATPLAEAAQSLSEQGRQWSGTVERLEVSQTDWEQTHGKALESWKETAKRIEKAAQSLQKEKALLQGSVSALQEAASTLAEVTQISKQFEERLRSELAVVTDRHLENLEPLFQQVRDMAQKLQDEGLRVNHFVEGQSRFIQQLILELAEEWKIGNGGAPEVPA